MEKNKKTTGLYRPPGVRRQERNVELDWRISPNQASSHAPEPSRQDIVLDDSESRWSEESVEYDEAARRQAISIHDANPKSIIDKKIEEHQNEIEMLKDLKGVTISESAEFGDDGVVRI